MPRERRRKCRCCGQLYHPDPRKCRPGLPPGQQGRQPTALAGVAQGAELLPRLGQPDTCANLAEGPSGLLAALPP